MLSWLINPMNPLKAVTFAGLGKLMMALRQEGSGITPSADTRNPTNLTWVETSSFCLEIMMPNHQQLSKMRRTRCQSSLIILPSMRKSSTNFHTPGIPSIAFSNRQHHRPILAQQYRKQPQGNMKVMRRLLFSLSGIWWYPWTTSILQKTLDLGLRPEMISCEDGKGWTSWSKYLFKLVKSVTRQRHVSPGTFLSTKNAGEIQSVGPSTLVMIPSVKALSMTWHMGSSQWSGTFQVVRIFVGVIMPAFRWIFIS